MDYEPGILLGAGNRTVNKTSHTCSHDSQSGGKTDAKHTLNSVWTSVVTLSPAPGLSPGIAIPEVRGFPFHPNIIKLGVKRRALFLWLYLASNIFRPSNPPQVNPLSSKSHHSVFWLLTNSVLQVTSGFCQAPPESCPLPSWLTAQATASPSDSHPGGPGALRPPFADTMKIMHYDHLCAPS